MSVTLFMLLLILTGSHGAGVVDDRRPLEVVPLVDLARYGGKWFEIGRLPNSFQKKCAGEVTAVYSQLDDGKLRVVNECKMQNGEVTRVEGRARVANPSGPNSKLEVRFAPAWLGWLPVVWGDYWIIELAPDYSYSVIGTPDRQFLWILSRSPRMDESVYEKIIERTAEKGFDVSRVTRTQQSD